MRLFGNGIRPFGLSIKTKIVINVAVIHAVLIGVVVVDINRRQSDFLKNEQIRKSIELSSIIATNAANSMLLNDMAGMKEIIAELSGVKDARMVFLLDREGKVRASNKERYFNKFLDDNISKELMQKAKTASSAYAQIEHDHLIDTLYSIKVQGSSVGYVRVLIDNSVVEEELRVIARNGIVYGVLAVFFGSLMAYLAVRGMSRDLDRLTEAAQKIANREFDQKLLNVDSNSEIASVAKAFSAMSRSIEENINKLKSDKEEMEWQATHDPLTGLNNRAGFEESISELVENSRADGTTHALLFLDLDRFKIVNDKAGHLAGDKLLIELSLLMQKAIRQKDLLFRFGGDEFGILLKDCDEDHASIVAKKLIETIASYEFFWDGERFQVGASIGIAVIDRDSKSAIDVLSKADEACYRAKELGRNREVLA